jgi:hypothetical protein
MGNFKWYAEENTMKCSKCNGSGLCCDRFARYGAFCDAGII